MKVFRLANKHGDWLTYRFYKKEGSAKAQATNYMNRYSASQVSVVEIELSDTITRVVKVLTRPGYGETT